MLPAAFPGSFPHQTLDVGAHGLEGGESRRTHSETKPSAVEFCFAFDAEKNLLAGQTLQLNNDIKS